MKLKFHKIEQNPVMKLIFREFVTLNELIAPTGRVVVRSHNSFAKKWERTVKYRPLETFPLLYENSAFLDK